MKIILDDQRLNTKIIYSFRIIGFSIYLFSISVQIQKQQKSYSYLRMKTVEKYQFDENTLFYQDGVNAYLATHTILNKKFIVKMITFGTDRQKENNNYITKQCNIMKKITHYNVYKCHKLLKSKNNFYAVFDFIEGKSLQEVLKQQISIENKTLIFKQLIQLVLQFRSKNIVSLNLDPNNIIVQENYKIILKNFGWAQEFNADQREILLQTNKFNQNDYAPPEILQGRIYPNSDYYSLGIIVCNLFANQFKKIDIYKQKVILNLDKLGIISNLSIENIKKLAADLTNKSTKERPDLKEALTIKKNYLSVIPQKLQKSQISKSNQKNKLKITEHIQKQILATSRSTSNLSGEQKGRQKIQVFDKLLQVILKKRGFTLLLLKLSQTIILNKQSELSLSVELSFLFVKKATIVISQLAKLLSKGFNSQYLINQKNLQLFQKDVNFSHLLYLINKEMKSTQQKFQLMLPKIKKMLEFSKNENLKYQTRSQSVSEEYINKLILQFLLQLRLINTDSYASDFQSDSLYLVFLLSMISDFKFLQEIYDVFFSQQVVEIKAQPLYKELASLPKIKIVELIQKNTTKLYSETQTSFDMSMKTTKTAKTFKTVKSNQ